MKKAITLIRKLSHNQSGAVALMFGLLMLPVLGMVGMAIDGVRAMELQRLLKQSLDAAALAGGRNFNDPNRDAIIRSYFASNWVSSQTFGSPTPTIAISADGLTGRLRVSGNAVLTSLLLGTIGFDTITVGSASEVERTDQVLEVALALDNTGSMRCPADSALGCPDSYTGYTRMEAVQDAATLLLDTIYGSKTTDTKLFVSLIPFVQAVNVGQGNIGWMDSAAIASVPWGAGPYPSSEGWRGCVQEDITHVTVEDPPTTYKFQPYYAKPTTVNINWAPVMGKSGFMQAPPYIAGFSPVFGSGRNSGCGLPAIGLTNDRTTVQASINNMNPSIYNFNKIPAITEANSYGYPGTQINVGLSWAWRSVSPEWRGLWDGVAVSRPANYGASGNTKAIVLLTDGENEFYPGFATGMGLVDFNGSTYSLPSLGISSTSFSTAYAQGRAALDAKVTETCRNIRAKGVAIYIVAYALPPGASATRTMIRDCVGDDSRYFDTANATELNTAFRTIGQDLLTLRLTH